MNNIEYRFGQFYGIILLAFSLSCCTSYEKEVKAGFNVNIDCNSLIGRIYRNKSEIDLLNNYQENVGMVLTDRDGNLTNFCASLLRSDKELIALFEESIRIENSNQVKYKIIKCVKFRVNQPSYWTSGCNYNLIAINHFKNRECIFDHVWMIEIKNGNIEMNEIDKNEIKMNDGELSCIEYRKRPTSR